MEIERTQTIIFEPSSYAFAGNEGADDSRERLNAILSANADICRQKTLFRTDLERLECALLKNRITTKKAFAYFGLLLGIFPPAAIFLKLFHSAPSDSGLFILLFFVNLTCAVSGYFSGKLVGKMISDIENRSWSFMLFALPFIGALWGIITGGAGGILIFVIGAFFGSLIAAIIGSVAFPAFAILHRWLKKGEMIERNQFLPLAFGITTIISAFILGL